MAEWSRIVNTTIAKYMREEEVNILRNRKLLALLKSRGRIKMNLSGDKYVKRVRYKRAPMVGYADGDTLTFSRRDRWKTTELDWRGYSVTDAMSVKERLMNKSTEAIIDIYAQLAESLKDDIDDQFGDELYVDGNATGNNKKIHGIESFFGNGGAAAAGYIASPSDTYANLSTVLGNYGGSWSSNGSSQIEWPTGTGDAHYDFWSPLIVDYTDTLWAASSDTWANNCTEAMRYGIIHSKKNKTKKGELDYISLTGEMYRAYLNTLDPKQQININQNQGTGLLSLGFQDVTRFDGVEVTWEYGQPQGVGYGVNVDYIELNSLQGQLFETVGPDFDIATQTWRTMIRFFGNAWFNPRYQLKFAAVT
ncbi:MAG TPA: phage major capsid protein [Gemmataceae bacterium]|nr:phage major capsid protein [Gemmataceae bacterium]